MPIPGLFGAGEAAGHGLTMSSMLSRGIPSSRNSGHVSGIFRDSSSSLAGRVAQHLGLRTSDAGVEIAAPSTVRIIMISLEMSFCHQRQRL